MHVYEKVRDYLDTHHINLKTVAKAAGIPNTTLSAILSGKRKMYAEDLKAICVALNVSADTFVTGSQLEHALSS